jgi:hypothetical protein
MAGKLSVDTKNFIPSILIIAFLLVGFVPNLQAVDKVSPQWVYFTVVNILSAIYLFLNRDRFEVVVKKVLSTGISLFLHHFFCMGGSFIFLFN